MMAEVITFFGGLILLVLCIVLLNIDEQHMEEHRRGLRKSERIHLSRLYQTKRIMRLRKRNAAKRNPSAKAGPKADTGGAR